ncbi:unnamed protein product [Caenorhabditis auriculariae]|uniref:Uncharacterized protein n=1 Tax=Caenorhabditis auriculariae TaxID=2777116 RepID=A0A8S1HIH5_9PELO|nr:unnamed protein product [Caenorhabditis auriculariae]
MARLKSWIFYIFGILWTLSSFSAADECCKRSMWAYSSGDAMPPECITLFCTDSVIHIEGSDDTKQTVVKFLNTAKKTGPIAILDNTVVVSAAVVKEIVVNGPGPAIYLRNSSLHEPTAFIKLDKISVDNHLRYCEKYDLLRLEGPIGKDLRERLETVANRTLADCKKVTTAAPTAAPTIPTATSNGTPVVPPQCVRSVSAALAVASAKAQAKAEEKHCQCSSEMMIGGIIAIAILLILLCVATSCAVKLFFFRKNEDLALAEQLSYAAQLLNSTIFMESGRDKAMLNGYMADGLILKRTDLLRLVKNSHDMAAIRKKKFEANQPLDPKTDLGDKKGKFWIQPLIFELQAKHDLTEDFVEAAQKFETVRKAHVAGREFDPPKGTRIWSDLRLKDLDKMMITKLHEQQIVDVKAQTEQDKKPAKVLKRRQRGGVDPPTNSVAKTDQPKKEEPKRMDAKKEDEKKSGAKKDETKKNDATNGDAKKGETKKNEIGKKDEQPVIFVAPEDIVKRVLKEDQPKETFTMPLGSLALENCHPLSLTTPVPIVYELFKGKSKALQETFAVMVLILDELQDYYQIHGKALELINLNASDVEVKVIENVRENASREAYHSNFPYKLAKKSKKHAFEYVPFQPIVGYDELKRLRLSSNAKEKRLLELLESEHATMANLLHAEGLNYFYYFNSTVKPKQAVLPGERIGDAAKRIFKTEERMDELTRQLLEVYYTNHPEEKPEKRSLQQRMEKPPARKPLEDKNSKDKKTKN